MIRTTSALTMSIQWLVIAPRPNEAASPATVELCQSRAWCSMYDEAERPHQLDEEVGLLVVERGAAEAGDGLRAVRRRRPSSTSGTSRRASP